MRLSLNEIEVTVRKAALGVGFPLGLAEDAGAAAAWLATAGLPVAEPIAAALFHGCGEEPRLVSTGTVCTIATDTGRCSVLRAGPSACDLVIAAAASGKRIAVEAFVDVPMIAIAQAGIASADAALPLVVEIAGRPAALLGGSMPVLFAAPAELAALVCERVRIGIAGGPEQDAVPHSLVEEREAVLAQGLRVNPELWRRVQAMAARTLVPATVQSRERGAGAGMIDTD